MMWLARCVLASMVRPHYNYLCGLLRAHTSSPADNMCPKRHARK
jgi:hypothetical protein